MKIAVFVSGGGTNLQAIIDNTKDGILKDIEITLVLSSTKNAYALERAANNGIKLLPKLRSLALNSSFLPAICLCSVPRS